MMQKRRVPSGQRCMVIAMSLWFATGCSHSEPEGTDGKASGAEPVADGVATDAGSCPFPWSNTSHAAVLAERCSVDCGEGPDSQWELGEKGIFALGMPDSTLKLAIVGTEQLVFVKGSTKFLRVRNDGTGSVISYRDLGVTDERIAVDGVCPSATFDGVALLHGGIVIGETLSPWSAEVSTGVDGSTLYEPSYEQASDSRGSWDSCTSSWLIGTRVSSDRGRFRLEAERRPDVPGDRARVVVAGPALGAGARLFFAEVTSAIEGEASLHVAPSLVAGVFYQYRTGSADFSPRLLALLSTAGGVAQAVRVLPAFGGDSQSEDATDPFPGALRLVPESNAMLVVRAGDVHQVDRSTLETEWVIATTDLGLSEIHDALAYSSERQLLLGGVQVGGHASHLELVHTHRGLVVARSFPIAQWSYSARLSWGAGGKANHPSGPFRIYSSVAGESYWSEPVGIYAARNGALSCADMETCESVECAGICLSGRCLSP